MSSQPSSREKAAKISPAAVLALSLVAVSLFFAAGGAETGTGLVFLLAGAGFVFYPPEKPLPASWLLFACLLLLLITYPFIPGLSMVSGDWRKEAVSNHGLAFASSLTPQRWMTFDGSLMLVLGLALFYYWSLQAPEASNRRHILRFFSVILVVFGLVISILFFLKITLPGWNSPRNLGPFENRNQLASVLFFSLLILMALLSNDLKKNKAWALLWGAGALFQFYLLVLNYSRAGIILFFAGGLLWICFNFRSGRQMGSLALVFATLAVLLSSFLIWGGATLARFEEKSGFDFSTSSRVSIQKDALQLFDDHAATGIGLGNFSSIFPYYRTAFQSESFVRHPESDWLWLGTEAGVPGLLAFLVLGVLWLVRVLPLKNGTDKHFRSACAIAVILIMAHGFIDVPLHRIGVALPVIFLASLAMVPLPDNRAGRRELLAWRVSGGLFMVWGIANLVEATGLWHKPGSYFVRYAVEQMPVLWTEEKNTEGLELADRALKSSPLSWDLYYWKASFLLKTGDIAGARENFRRARFFEKNSPTLALSESLQWLPIREDLALAAANETLSRSRYAPEVPFNQLAAEATKLGKEDFLKKLKLMTRSYPDLYHIYLEVAPEEDFDLWLNDDKQNSPSRGAYWFWNLLSKRKSEDGILAWLSDHPDRQSYFYNQGSSILASRKEWREAYLLFKNHMPEAVLPEALQSDEAQQMAEKKYLLDPSDVGAAAQVIQMNLADGHYSVALERAVTALEAKKIPPYFHYLAARACEGMEDWEKAYVFISRYDALRSQK